MRDKPCAACGQAKAMADNLCSACAVRKFEEAMATAKELAAASGEERPPKLVARSRTLIPLRRITSVVPENLWVLGPYRKVAYHWIVGPPGGQGYSRWCEVPDAAECTGAACLLWQHQRNFKAYLPVIGNARLDDGALVSERQVLEVTSRTLVDLDEMPYVQAEVAFWREGKGPRAPVRAQLAEKQRSPKTPIPTFDVDPTLRRAGVLPPLNTHTDDEVRTLKFRRQA